MNTLIRWYFTTVIVVFIALCFLTYSSECKAAEEFPVNWIRQTCIGNPENFGCSIENYMGCRRLLGYCVKNHRKIYFYSRCFQDIT